MYGKWLISFATALMCIFPTILFRRIKLIKYLSSPAGTYVNFFYDFPPFFDTAENKNKNYI